MRNALNLTWITLLLIGCTAGLISAQSLEDRLFYAKSQVEASYRTVGDLAVQKRISRDEGLKLVGQIDVAHEAINAAQTALIAGDTDGAESKLRFAQTLLLQLEAVLKARGGTS